MCSRAAEALLEFWLSGEDGVGKGCVVGVAGVVGVTGDGSARYAGWSRGT